MTKAKCTIRVNGGKEIDIDDKKAAIEALTPMVERALAMTKPATVGDNSEVKSILDRADIIANEIESKNEDMKELWLEAKNKGHDVKALKAAHKELRKPIESEFKAKVNSYIMVAGQYQLFAE